MKNYSETEVLLRIRKGAYKLKYRRREGFDDNSLESMCIVNEIRYLYGLLSKKLQSDLLDMTWLDE
jgi:hypothetical protein